MMRVRINRHIRFIQIAARCSFFRYNKGKFNFETRRVIIVAMPSVRIIVFTIPFLRRISSF